MGFPTVASYNKAGAGTGTSDVTVSFTASVGDLVIIAAGISIASGTVAATGWTNIMSSVSIWLGISQTMSIMYRVIDGSEGGVATIPRGSSCYMACVYYVISASTWDGTTPPEVAHTSMGGGSNANPPSLNPSGWGTEDSLWVAGYFYRNQGTTGQPTAYPTNYTSNQLDGYVGGSYGHMVLCSRELNAASEDPGAFNNGASGGHAFTVAVRPAAAGGGSPTLPQIERGRTLGRGLGRGLE